MEAATAPRQAQWTFAQWGIVVLALAQLAWAVAGLIAAYSSVIATAIWRVFARYVLHQGYAIDQFYNAVIQQSTALVKTNPDAEAPPVWRRVSA